MRKEAAADAGCRHAKSRSGRHIGRSVMVVRNQRSGWRARRVRRGSSPSTRRADAFVGAGRGGTGLETSTDHLHLPDERTEGRTRKTCADAYGGSSHEACFKRDPPEEPPSEEHYHAEGRSPGSRVIASVPAFPALLHSASDTKWDFRSPLTVAGAAPDSVLTNATGFPS
jgi:hypothetical protein